MKKVSACIICRNEENNIQACLESIKGHVDEIVVVDTGSTDNTPEIAKKYADVFAVYTECNDSDGKIADFSKARNYSVSLASHDWIWWHDADDIVINPENIRKIVEKYESYPVVQIMFPYEYSQDANGLVDCLHYRERLVYPKSKFSWTSPVHEVFLSHENPYTDTSTEVKVSHQHKVAKSRDPLRNFRIIKKFVDEIGERDARQLYYLGLEYGNIGCHNDAVRILNRYVELSGWDDERVLALLRVCDHYITMAWDNYNYDEFFDLAIKTVFKAASIKESWFEVWYALGKCYFNYAKKCESKNREAHALWEKAVHYFKIALDCPETKTMLFVSTADRLFNIHTHYNMSLMRIGRFKEALESINSALKHSPEDKNLLFNKALAQEILWKVDVATAAAELLGANKISKENFEIISKCIENANVNVLSPAHVSGGNWKPYHRPKEYPTKYDDSDFPVASLTPHSQAWGIPEEFVHDDLPLKMTDRQLKSVVGLVWKEFMLHDELLSAKKFLENCPYRVRHTDFVNRLLYSTNRMMDWTQDEHEYDVGNSSIDHQGNIATSEMIPLPRPLLGAAGMRYQWIKDRIPDKSSKILDLGCIDGEMTNRWGLEGYDVTGVDVCTNSVRIANSKAEEFKTGARHYRSLFKNISELFGENSFDVITTEDTYEHVTDRVNEMLKPARRVVKENGRLLLVTPHGCWYRGKFVAHMHPWLWRHEGKHWLTEQPRGHLIAPSIWSVVDELRESGWWVKSSAVFNQWHQEVEGQGNVCAEALAQRPAPCKGTVVFYSGIGCENWNPNSVDLTGIGGSELATIHMAKQLVQAGYDVKVYNSCGQFGEGIYDGVEYHDVEKYHDISCDVLIVSRWAPAVGDSFNVKAKVKLLWTHDVWPISLTHDLSLKYDKILVLTNWHRDFVKNHYKFISDDQFIVTRNGIAPERFDEIVERNHHKVVYSSSPDRGLEALLNSWKDIRQHVPDAQLHVFYGFKNWRVLSNGDEASNARMDAIIKQMEALKDHGVVMRDRVPQHVIAKEFLGAGAWLYPTWFSETSCITAMEAQAAGLSIVTSPIAALLETVADRGVMIEGDWLSKEYAEKFVAAAVDALTNTSDDQRQQLMKYARDNFSWTGVAHQWISIFDQISEEKSLGTFALTYKEFVK